MDKVNGYFFLSLFKHAVSLLPRFLLNWLKCWCVQWSAGTSFLLFITRAACIDCSLVKIVMQEYVIYFVCTAAFRLVYSVKLCFLNVKFFVPMVTKKKVKSVVLVNLRIHKSGVGYVITNNIPKYKKSWSFLVWEQCHKCICIVGVTGISVFMILF